MFDLCVWVGKCVFLIGYIGFKGSWLVLWLCQFGVDVIGYSLVFEMYLNFFMLVEVKFVLVGYMFGDICDVDVLCVVMIVV